MWRWISLWRAQLMSFPLNVTNCFVIHPIRKILNVFHYAIHIHIVLKLLLILSRSTQWILDLLLYYYSVCMYWFCFKWDCMYFVRVYREQYSNGLIFWRRKCLLNRVRYTNPNRLQLQSHQQQQQQQQRREAVVALSMLIWTRAKKKNVNRIIKVDRSECGTHRIQSKSQYSCSVVAKNKISVILYCSPKNNNHTFTHLALILRISHIHTHTHFILSTLRIKISVQNLQIQCNRMVTSNVNMKLTLTSIQPNVWIAMRVFVWLAYTYQPI